MIKVSDLFNVHYGHSLELNKLNQVERNCGIPFVSRVNGNNGISAYVEYIKDTPPISGNVLTCALGGNGVMSTFLQKKPFYSGRDVAYLIPKRSLTDIQLLFYCYCLNQNKFRFNYGRQANKTLKSLLIPSIDEISSFVGKAKLDIFLDADRPKLSCVQPKLNTQNWGTFKFSEIFNIFNGFYNKKPPISLSITDIPFIGATEKQNGITSYIKYDDLKKYSRNGEINIHESIDKKLFPANAITVSNNGSVGEAFYQPKPFTCSHDVNPLYLKDTRIKLTPCLALFLCTIIRKEKYRWGYGRKWRPLRMPDSIIKLPITNSGTPDWDFMENFIKTIEYSSSI